MKLTIKWTNIKPIDSLEIFIKEKIGGLAKRMSHFEMTGIAEAWIEIGKKQRHHKKGEVFYAEADLRAPGRIVRAEATRKDLRLAIVQVKQELEKRLKAYTDSLRAKELRGARAVKRWSKTRKIAEFPYEKRKLHRREREEGL